MKKLHQIMVSLILLPFAMLSTSAVSDNRSYADDFWLDWKEDSITAFPQFNVERAIPIELDRRSQLQWAVDPDTITMGKDRIIRYVVMGTSQSGIVNAMYEGIHCKEASYKVYARTIGKKEQEVFEWRAVDSPEWQKTAEAPPNSHVRMLAKMVMCDQNSSISDMRQVFRRLENPYGASHVPGERNFR